MSLPDEASQQISTDVIVPINLVRQTIVYLESCNDPMAMMLRQHYKSWLKMSMQQDQTKLLDAWMNYPFLIPIFIVLVFFFSFPVVIVPQTVL